MPFLASNFLVVVDKSGTRRLAPWVIPAIAFILGVIVGAVLF